MLSPPRRLNRRQNEAICRVAEGSRSLGEQSPSRIGAFRRCDCLLCIHLFLMCVDEGARMYSPADKSTVNRPTVQPSRRQRFRVHGRRRGPPRSPASSGDLAPTLSALIDYLQAQHGGSPPSFFPLSPRFSSIINESFFSPTP